jgi:oligoribonuclease NrnB/cAMP/cGMP phosphodiesterase (DHH superfamily)
VDITPPKGRWEEWLGLSPTVLDHHETVMYVVNSLNGKYGDSDHSGAMLAFENVMVPLANGLAQKQSLEFWEKLAHLCMVRDTWKTASPDWDSACALAHALLLYGQEWGVSVAIADKVPFDELLLIGAKIHDNIRRQSKSIAKNSPRRSVEIDGSQAVVTFFNHANGGTMSDIAHFVMDMAPCNAAISYFFTYDDGEIRNVMSVRTDGCFSARKLAESFGGGGHNKAAGFTILGEYSPNQIVETVVERISTLNK